MSNPSRQPKHVSLVYLIGQFEVPSSKAVKPNAINYFIERLVSGCSICKCIKPVITIWRGWSTNKTCLLSTIYCCPANAFNALLPSTLDDIRFIQSIINSSKEKNKRTRFTTILQNGLLFSILPDWQRQIREITISKPNSVSTDRSHGILYQRTNFQVIATIFTFRKNQSVLYLHVFDSSILRDGIIVGCLIQSWPIQQYQQCPYFCATFNHSSLSECGASCFSNEQ